MRGVAKSQGLPLGTVMPTAHRADHTLCFLEGKEPQAVVGAQGPSRLSDTDLCASMLCAGFLRDTYIPSPCIPTSLLEFHSLLQRLLLFFFLKALIVTSFYSFHPQYTFFPFPVKVPWGLARPSGTGWAEASSCTGWCRADSCHMQTGAGAQLCWMPALLDGVTCVPPAHPNLSPRIPGLPGGNELRLCRVGSRDRRFWGLQTRQADEGHGVPSLELRVRVRVRPPLSGRGNSQGQPGGEGQGRGRTTPASAQPRCITPHPDPDTGGMDRLLRGCSEAQHVGQLCCPRTSVLRPCTSP